LSYSHRIYSGGFRIWFKVVLSYFVIFASITAPLPAQEQGSQEEAQTVRLGDIGRIEGVRENQLIGFGLVTGLQGEGDSPRSEVSKKMLANFFSAFQSQIETDAIQSKNSAAVVVSAEVPSFIRPGQRIDVEVSSLLDARNIDGGVLLQTNLQAANGQVYAVAQGRVEGARPASGKSTIGRILEGAIVEEPVLSRFDTNEGVALLLDRADFSTVIKARDALRQALPDYKIRALDAAKIEILPGEEAQYDSVELSALVESVEIVPDNPATVVINRYSGVVVMGQNVRVAPVLISFDQGELSIGADRFKGEAESEGSVEINRTARVKDLVEVLKTAGLKVDDIIEVLRTLERAGALYGTVETM